MEAMNTSKFKELVASVGTKGLALWRIQKNKEKEQKVGVRYPYCFTAYACGGQN